MPNQIKFRSIGNNEICQKYMEDEAFKLVLNPVQPAFLKSQMSKGVDIVVIPESQKVVMEVYALNQLNVVASRNPDIKKIDEKQVDVRMDLLALGFKEKEPYVFTTHSTDIFDKIFNSKNVSSALNIPYIFLLGDRIYRVATVK